MRAKLWIILDQSVNVSRHNNYSLTLGSESGSDCKVKLGKRVTAKMKEGDIRGAVRLLASDCGVAPADDDILAKLKARNLSSSSEGPLPNPPDPEVEANIVAMANMVSRAVTSFSAGSAGGPDKLKPQYLKDLLSFSAGDAASRLLEALTSVLNLISSGGVNLSVISFMFGANLTALKKKNEEVRPIAVGNTLRRLAGKVNSQHIQEDLGAHLRPVQMGFGVKEGCEASIHAVRAFLHSQSSMQVLLKIDYSNAFHSIR